MDSKQASAAVALSSRDSQASAQSAWVSRREQGCQEHQESSWLCLSQKSKDQQQRQDQSIEQAKLRRHCPFLFIPSKHYLLYPPQVLPQYLSLSSWHHSANQLKSLEAARNRSTTREVWVRSSLGSPDKSSSAVRVRWMSTCAVGNDSFMSPSFHTLALAQHPLSCVCFS